MSGPSAEILVARLAPGRDGQLHILSPAIGYWLDPPAARSLVAPGGGLGRIERLSRRFRLIAPAGATGRVLDGIPTQRIVPVGYGDLLLALAPLGADGDLDTGSPDLAPAGSFAEAGPAVLSPTDGVFYGAPSPGAEPYVRVGHRIRLGDPVGLVEVMKTFHQLSYDGPGFPEEAEVVEVRARDGAEVRAGEVLFRFR